MDFEEWWQRNKVSGPLGPIDEQEKYSGYITFKGAYNLILGIFRGKISFKHNGSVYGVEEFQEVGLRAFTKKCIGWNNRKHKK